MQNSSAPAESEKTRTKKKNDDDKNGTNVIQSWMGTKRVSPLLARRGASKSTAPRRPTPPRMAGKAAQLAHLRCRSWCKIEKTRRNHKARKTPTQRTPSPRNRKEFRQRIPSIAVSTPPQRVSKGPAARTASPHPRPAVPRRPGQATGRDGQHLGRARRCFLDSNLVTRRIFDVPRPRHSRESKQLEPTGQNARQKKVVKGARETPPTRPISLRPSMVDTVIKKRAPCQGRTGDSCSDALLSP